MAKTAVEFAVHGTKLHLVYRPDMRSPDSLRKDLAKGKPVTIKGTFTMEPTGAIKATSTFTINPEDYGIAIPAVVRDNIAKEITIKVQMDYVKM